MGPGAARGADHACRGGRVMAWVLREHGYVTVYSVMHKPGIKG
jgi:hypothetical protein